MKSEERIKLVLKYKTQILQGRTVDLVPCNSTHAEKIVRLRNQEKSRRYLNQNKPLTLARHNTWFQEYLKKDDDLYWCIFDKQGRFVGVIRLYNIKADGSSCFQGSFAIDENLAMSGPFALETELITIDFAFDVLKLEKILNDNKIDNKNMNSISRRLGFSVVKDFERDGINYRLYELTKVNYKRDLLEKSLQSWLDR